MSWGRSQRYHTERRLSILEQKMANEQPGSAEQVIEEIECCGDDVKEIDIDPSFSLLKRRILSTEAEVTIPPTQMSADGRKKGAMEMTRKS